MGRFQRAAARTPHTPEQSPATAVNYTGDVDHTVASRMGQPPLRGVRVSFVAGERPAARRIARRLFGRPLTARDYADLAGALDNAQVEIGACGDAMYLELGDLAAARYRAYYYVRREAGGIVLLNDGFRVSLGARGCGLGLRIFCRQAAAAATLGVNRIELVAGRRRDENGYYTWPRFGFDGRLPAGLRRELPTDLRAARTVLDLMEHRRGRLWWRERGATISAAFDLSSGSRSRAVLRRYLRDKKNREMAQKENLPCGGESCMLSVDDDARHNGRRREEET